MPVASTNNPTEWLVVLSTDNLPEAHIIAGRLQHEGIPSWVHQQPGASGLGITVGLLGEVKVLVAAEDYAAALAIIEQDSPPELEASLDDIQYIFPDDEDDVNTS
jgi:hypothetical protein